MKLNSLNEIQMFLIECGREDLISETDIDYKPSKEMVELFIKRRKNVISHLKDFRKKQMGKAQWRQNRYEMMKGIKTFHKSTKGKKFHRALGRFLATRIPYTRKSMLSIRRMGEVFYGDSEGANEVFKALSSYKTHACLQKENFMSTNEAADYDIFLEHALKSISNIERELLSSDPEIKCEDLDFLAATINYKSILDPICNEQDFSNIEEKFKKLLKSHEKEEFPYLLAISKLK